MSRKSFCNLSFLSGHDANVESSLTALGAAGYKLPNAIEKQAPVGCKLIFLKWIREYRDITKVTKAEVDEML